MAKRRKAHGMPDDRPFIVSDTHQLIERFSLVILRVRLVLAKGSRVVGLDRLLRRSAHANASYPTYQGFLALGIAALITDCPHALWIKILKYESIGQQVRADGPKRHLVKGERPPWAAWRILIAIVLTCLIMAKHTTEMLLALSLRLPLACSA